MIREAMHMDTPQPPFQKVKLFQHGTLKESFPIADRPLLSGQGLKISSIHAFGWLNKVRHATHNL